MNDDLHTKTPAQLRALIERIGAACVFATREQKAEYRAISERAEAALRAKGLAR